MRFPRSSGILLHPTSLPGRYGIGDLGPEAHCFAEFLASAGQKLWQVLPLGPTGYGDSPYQLFSAFAGNPLLISLDELIRRGLLAESDIAPLPPFPEECVDFSEVIRFKWRALRAAYRGFNSDCGEFTAFCGRNSWWLEDYALFMALKHASGGESVWTTWEPPIASRQSGAMAEARDRLRHEIGFHKFTQVEFFRQWAALQNYCHERGIRIMGDVPIYVAHDSAEVWARPELFELDRNGEPIEVAGVPPDYFSEVGQLWGNPIYRWDRMADSGYEWWIARMRAALASLDVVRLDHFRGFEAYWEVPATQRNAIHGRWVKGPGAALFEALRKALGELPLVAENLGVITPEVEGLRKQFGFPGMAILQFAFGTDPQGPDFRPHNYSRDLVAYTGTHDNDTTVGWWSSSGAGHSTRTLADVCQEREFAQRYLAAGGREIHWVFIGALMASVADTIIVPLQDVLGLGSAARMNTPATPSGNWRWRYRSSMLTDRHAGRLSEMAATYDR
jgi:4-alpha-glucanotransferase